MNGELFYCSCLITLTFIIHMLSSFLDTLDVGRKRCGSISAALWHSAGVQSNDANSAYGRGQFVRTVGGDSCLFGEYWLKEYSIFYCWVLRRSEGMGRLPTRRLTVWRRFSTWLTLTFVTVVITTPTGTMCCVNLPVFSQPTFWTWKTRVPLRTVVVAAIGSHMSVMRCSCLPNWPMLFTGWWIFDRFLGRTFFENRSLLFNE